MGFVGGDLQGEFMARVRGVDPRRCLAVPVDVGKWSAMALVADHHGEVMVAPFSFDLDEPGVRWLVSVIKGASSDREAVVCRVGVEAAGHYYRTLVARLRTEETEVVELNPTSVKQARAQQLLGRLKSDERDLGAMAELLVRGAGRRPQIRDEAMAAQAAWVAHRRRKVAAHVALSKRVQGHLDLVFRGLGACFDGILGTKAGRVIVRDLADPDRMRRLGIEGLRRFVACRGVALRRAKVEVLIEAAAVALRLPPAERAPVAALLAADVAPRRRRRRDRPSRPGPGRGPRGDPGRRGRLAAGRWGGPGQRLRASGLVPAEYSSAGRTGGGQGISREGSVELRSATIEFGPGLAGHTEDFGAYR